MTNIDNNTLLLLVVVSFALVAIAGSWFFQRRGKVKVQGLFGTRFELDASSKPAARPPAVKVSDAMSRNGRLAAKDLTGRRVEARGGEVEGNITASIAPGDLYPKA